LGGVFLKNMYSIYDFDPSVPGGRIGFAALAVGGNAGTGPVGTVQPGAGGSAGNGNGNNTGNGNNNNNNNNKGNGGVVASDSSQLSPGWRVVLLLQALTVVAAGVVSLVL
jgi:hypothetical protein